MSLFNVFNVIGFVMSVEFVCLNIILSNFVNVDSVSSLVKDIYKVCYVVFGVELSKVCYNWDYNVLVKVLGIVESDKLLNVEYNLDYLLVNDEGYIYKLNVNVMEEMVNMIFVFCLY